MTLTETPTTLSATGNATAASTVIIVSKHAAASMTDKQFGWRSLPATPTSGVADTIGSTAAGAHTTTTLQNTDAVMTVNAYKGYRVTKTAASGGVVQSSEITSNTADTFTFSPAMGNAPVNGDAYTIEPPVGYRPLVTSYTVSWGDDWVADGTIIISSLNAVGTTTLETFQTAAGTGGTATQSVVELYGPVHGNLQFVTSQNGHCSVQLNYRWLKTGAQLQRC